MLNGRVEQVLERIFGDGLEGNFREQRLSSCIQSHLEYFHRRSVHNLLWEFIPERDYSNAERMLATPGFTRLLVNLESMIAKLEAGVGCKNCVAWKIVKAVDYFDHTDKITADSSTD